MEKKSAFDNINKDKDVSNDIFASAGIDKKKDDNQDKNILNNNTFNSNVEDKAKNHNDKSVEDGNLNNLLTLFSGLNNKKDNNIIGNKNDKANNNNELFSNNKKSIINTDDYIQNKNNIIQQNPYHINKENIQQSPYLYQSYTPLFQPYQIQQPYFYFDKNNIANQNKDNGSSNKHNIGESDDYNFIHKSASAQNDYLRGIETDVRQVFKEQEKLLSIGVDSVISNYYKKKEKDDNEIDTKIDSQLQKLDNSIKDLENTLKNPLLEVNFNSAILMEGIFELVSNDLKTSRGGYFYLISILKKFNDHLKEQMNEKIDEIDKQTNKPTGKKKNKLPVDTINEIKKVSTCVDNILDGCEFIDVNDIKEEIKKRIKYINDKMSLGLLQGIKYKIMDFIVGENYHKSAVLCKKYLKDIFWELDNFNNVQKKDDKQQSLEKIIEAYGKYTKELSSMSTWLLYPDDKYSIGGKNDKLSNFVNQIKKEKDFDATSIFVGLFKIFGANNFVDAISNMKDEKFNKFVDILCDNIPINNLTYDEKKNLFKLSLKEENDKEKHEKIAKKFGIEIDDNKDEKKDYKKDIKYKRIEDCCEGIIGKISANGTKKKFSKKQSYEEAMNEKGLLIISNNAFDDKSKRVSICIDSVVETINKNIDRCNNYMTNLLAKEVDCGAMAYYNEMQGRLLNTINYYYAKLIEIVNSEFSDNPDAKKNMERAKLKIEEQIKVYSEEKDGILKPKSGDEKSFATLINGLDFRDISKETIDKRNELCNKIYSAFQTLIMRIQNIKPPVEQKSKIQLYKEIKDMSERNRSSYENIKTRELYNKGLEDLNQKLIEAIKANKPEREERGFGMFR